MPDPRPAGNGFEQMALETKAQRQRTRAVEQPSGTQLVRLKETVENRLEQIPGEVSAAISAQSMTRADIQAGLDGKANTTHEHAGESITSGTLGIPVDSPTVTSSGDLRGATLYASGAPGYNITGTRVAAWWQTADGRAGTASSSQRYKTNIEPWTVDPERVLQVEPVFYQYREAVWVAESQRAGAIPFAYDPDAHAPLEVGFIAERLHELGLWEFVVYQRNPTGALLRTAAGEPIPDGIHYINWGIALQAVARWERDQRVALERRVDAIAEHLDL
jgi:hypothetical protein